MVDGGSGGNVVSSLDTSAVLASYVISGGVTSTSTFTDTIGRSFTVIDEAWTWKRRDDGDGLAGVLART